MSATLLHLTPALREAKLDVKAIERKAAEARGQAYEWMPAIANARQRLADLARKLKEEIGYERSQSDRRA
jgi:hypothetical protein